MNAIARVNATSEVERLERALTFTAYIVALDGPVAAPLFDRLERELAAARAAVSTVARARDLLAGFKGIAPWSPASDPPNAVS